MSDYISKSALLETLAKYKFGAISNDAEREYTKEMMLLIVGEQQTVDETEIIRKAFERVVEKIDDLDTYFDNGDFATCDDALVVLKCVLQIVKEEGGNE